MKYLKFAFVLLYICSFNFAEAQKINEILPPYNIKTISFQQGGQNVVPIFTLGESFDFMFDDLYGDDANYFYSIIHCDYNWNKSDLSRSEYLDGFDGQQIHNHENSFNTLQHYSHYMITLPNKQARFKVTGNYILQILNNNNEIVFTRKFILYENQVAVPVAVKRSRTMADIETKQNLDFSIVSKAIQFQNPLQNVKVVLMQNGKFEETISNIKPMYTLGNDLIYKYDQETSFYAGNEYYYFDNKDIRGAGNNISRVDALDIFNSHLYRNEARKNQIYTFYPDVNGNFVVRNLYVNNSNIEADYAWVYFSLSVPDYFGKNDIYIGGMFNNYSRSDEYKMEFNTDKNVYEKALMIKQGFTNYNYTMVDKKGKIDYSNAVDGNFFQTENDYDIIVYYRENGERYDRVIGRGKANSEVITN